MSGEAYKNMMATRRILERLANAPCLRLSLIRHDIPEREQGWFAECQMQHFSVFTRGGGDLLRTLCIGVMAWGSPMDLYLSAAALLTAIWLCEVAVRPLFGSFLDKAWKTRLNATRAFLLLRSVGWAYALGIMILHAPPSRLGIAIVFASAMVVFDIIYMAAVPVIALICLSIVMTGISGALLLTPGVNHTLVLAITALEWIGLYYAVLNIHYLFATRRLRTRRLSTANETIRHLLNQYDEHGSDLLVEVDRAGRLLRPSEKVCAMLGRPPDTLEGTPVSELFEAGRELNAVLSAGRKQRRFHNRLVSLPVAGEKRWLSVSGCPVYDTSGRHEGFRAFVHDVTMKRAAEERLRIMATCDALTGLNNRAFFTDELAGIFASGAPSQDCALLYIDLDSIKIINDTCGHAAGDAMLREAARRIAATVSPENVVARLGGDEFAVLLRARGDVANARELGEEIVSALTRPMDIEDKSFVCGASVGIARGPADGADADALLRAADIALYVARTNGTNRCVEFHPDMREKLQDRRRLELDLRNALDRGEFQVHYQPLIDIATSRVAGYEALLRWDHPERGAISPAEFIPIAEETGLIVQIGDWVLREALAEAAGWNSELTIAVNVSPAQMRGDALLTQVIGALASSGVAPGRLELEITETLLMDDSEQHLRALHQLRGFGVRIALDDFGTGYSSLNYLRSFPFDKLKIDRSFVKDLTVNPDSRSIVDTVLSLARRFRMETIAEGVEHESQLEVLASMGCQQVQGHLFDKAMPAHLIPLGQRENARSKPDDALAPPTADIVPMVAERRARSGRRAAEPQRQALATTLSGKSVPNTRW